MVSGEPEVVERARPVLEAVGSDVRHGRALGRLRPNRADHTGSQPGSTAKTCLKTRWGSHRPFASWSFL
jgi:hypothetical protein